MTRDRFWRWQRSAAPYLFTAPFVAIFCVFMLWPLGRSLILSFYKTTGPQQRIFIGLDNYRYLLGHDILFGLAVLNTTLYTVLYIAIQIPASLGLAVLLNSRRVRCRALFRFVFFSSYLVGQVFVGLIFYRLFSREGLANHLLHANVPWLTGPNWVIPSLLIASLWLMTGYGMVYLLAALQAVDLDLYDAAKVDGAGAWQVFRHITLPGIRPVLLYLTLVGIISGFQLFELPWVLFQGFGPSFRNVTIVMYLFAVGFNDGDLGYAAAIGWTLVLILLVVSIAHLRIFRLGREGES